MKLKGKTVAELSQEEKDKAEKTLQRMTEVRNKDTQVLRDASQKKLDWAMAEYNKGQDFIKQKQTEIENINLSITKMEDQLLRLEGAIIVLKELLNSKAQ